MQQVTWPALLPLSLRLHVSRALLSTGFPLHVLQGDAASLSVEEQYFRTSESQVGDGGRTRRSDVEADSGPALDGYFARVKADLSLHAVYPASQSLTANAKFQVLMATTERALCRDCSGVSEGAIGSHQCRWTERSEAADVRTVANRGLCIEPVSELFIVARDVTKAMYGQVLSEPPGHELRLETKSTGVTNEELELSVDARTYEVTPCNVRAVEVAFHVTTFQPGDYLALLYFFFHECLVHGYCGVNIEDDASPESEAFHEGWMDCVAAEVVEQLSTSGYLDREHPAVRFSEEFLDEMRTVRINRFNTRRPQSRYKARKWRRGRSARDTLLRVLEAAWREVELDQDAESEKAEENAKEALARFSYLVNASDLTHETRGKFVGGLNDLLTRNNAEEQTDLLIKHSEVVEFAVDFVKGGSWREFVERVVLYAERH